MTCRRVQRLLLCVRLLIPAQTQLTWLRVRCIFSLFSVAEVGSRFCRAVRQYRPCLTFLLLEWGVLYLVYQSWSGRIGRKQVCVNQVKQDEREETVESGHV
ncbi:hypothetical protein F5883DRAFT_30363 [Diaporthe sp. PMI_573]|nr:hypothetical protein F5883DRAFT_30363 [Diaporthaceae sp. PMI_573]